jgi:uncharacterized protein YbjT (DUF2867 family)
MILVAGATGIVGGMITRRLLEQDKDVRILVRHNSPSEQLAREGRATSAEELIEAGAEPVYGDLRDRASLDAALEGIETVITTANSVGRGGEDNPQSVDLEGNRNLIEAAREAGVEHFVFVSTLGADPDHPVPFMRGKGPKRSISKRERDVLHDPCPHAVHGSLGNRSGGYAGLARPPGHLGRRGASPPQLYLRP